LATTCSRPSAGALRSPTRSRKRTELGVARISVGGAFTYVADGDLIDTATELKERGTYGYWDRAAAARGPIPDALTC
jgi:hypothetical protein